MRCVVKTCSYTFKKGSGIRLHGFPKDAKLRQQWCAFIKQPNLEIIKNYAICSYHFTSDAYTTNNEGKVRLKRDAVPSKLSFMDDIDAKFTEQALIPLSERNSVCNNEEMDVDEKVSLSDLEVPEEKYIPPIDMVTITIHKETQTDIVADSNLANRFHSIEDFKFEDLNYPTPRKRYWDITQSMKIESEKERVKSDELSKRIGQLTKEVDLLKVECQKLKESKKILVYINTQKKQINKL